MSKKLTTHLTTVAAVAVGVAVAGYAMHKFGGDVPFLKEAQNGFQGVV